MNCPKCSVQNPEGAKYCFNCGALLKKEAGEPPTPPVMSDDQGKTKATESGLDQNVAALLSYVLGWITGLVFFLIEKENEYVRFHAMQSIVVFGAISIVSIILSVLSWATYFFAVISWLVWAASVVIWIVCMVKAYQGERFKLPLAGDIAEKQMKALH